MCGAFPRSRPLDMAGLAVPNGGVAWWQGTTNACQGGLMLVVAHLKQPTVGQAFWQQRSGACYQSAALHCEVSEPCAGRLGVEEYDEKG